MSINTAHAGNGVLFYATEYLLLFTDCAILDITGEHLVPLFGLKYGRLYLTSHRLIYMSRHPESWLQSASFPFVAMSNFGMKEIYYMDDFYVEGNVKPQPNGHFHNELNVKIQFTNGGEEIFCEFLKWCIASAKENAASQNITELPPYEPCSSWFELNDRDYEPPSHVKELIPEHPSFYEPEPNTFYAVGIPPPFVGIIEPLYRGELKRACDIEPPICCGRIVPPSKADLYPKRIIEKKIFEPGCKHLWAVCKPVEHPKPPMQDFGQTFTTSYQRLIAGKEQPSKELIPSESDYLYIDQIFTKPLEIEGMANRNIGMVGDVNDLTLPDEKNPKMYWFGELTSNSFKDFQNI